MKITYAFLVFLILNFGMASLGLSQPTSMPGQENMSQEKREKLHVLIQERFTQGLGLSADQSPKFVEIMKKYHQKRRELHEQMKAYHQQLESLSNSTDASQISQVLNNIQKTREEFQKLEEEQFKELKPLLTPQQQAKYFLMMDQIRHEMMQIRKGMPEQK